MKGSLAKKFIQKVRPFLLDLPAEGNRDSLVWRYGAAIAIVLVAFGIRYALNPLLGSHASFILFVPAITIVAWLGGVGPVFVAILIAFLLTNYFFISPLEQWSSFGVSQAVATAIYIFSALVVVGLINTVKRERARVAAKADEVLKHATQLQQEVDHRKQVEEQLREREGRLQSVVNSSSAMIFLKDLEGRYLLSNREFEAITHRPAAEIVGKTDRDLFPLEQAEAFRANDLKVTATGVASDFEEVALHDDGPHLSIVHKYPLRDSTGKIYALGGIVTDITARKRAEEALRKARQGYADLVSSIEGIVWEADPETWQFSFISKKAQRLLLYPIERWLNEPDFWQDHLHPDDRERVVAFCHRASREKRDHDIEYRIIAADGRIVWVRDIVKVVFENDEPVKLRGVMVDITQNKQAEEALKRSTEQYRSLYNNTPVMMHSIDQSGALLSVSNTWLRTLGYERNEVLGQKSVEFLTPQSQQYARDVVLPTFFKCGHCQDIPYQMVKKDGEIMDVLLSATAEKDGSGDIVRSLAVIIDVTAQKRAEQALRSSETKLRVLAETAADAIISTDGRGLITQFNRSAEQIFGYSTAEILGKPLTLLMPTKFQRAYTKAVERFSATGETKLMGQVTELTGIKKDGTEFPLEISLSAWETGEGKFFTGILRDITKRKVAEETLRHSEEMLRMTTEGAGIDVWSWEVPHDILECSLTTRLLGEEWKGEMKLRTFLSYVHREDRLWVKEKLADSLRDKVEFNVEYRILMSDGSVCWRHSKGRPAYENDRPVRLSGISMDVTERKQAEEALRQSEELLRFTTEGGDIGLWSWDIVHDVVTFNSVEYRQCGLRPGTKLDLQTVFQCIHPEDRDWLKEDYERCLREGGELNVEHRILWPDGTVRWNHSKGRVFHDKGRPVRLSGIALDITERKRAEEALQTSEALFQTLAKAAPVGIFRTDAAGDCLYVNERWCEISGLTMEAARGKGWIRALHPEDVDRVNALWYQSTQSGSLFQGEYRVLRPDGHTTWVLGQGLQERDATGNISGYVGTITDITERKHAEDELQKAKSALALHADELEHRVARRTNQLHRTLKDMESFCYSIAHDLRAPLRAMSGFSESLIQDFAPELGETGRDYCDRIHAAASRMNQLISDLLVYGRLTHQELPIQPVSLTAEIEKVMERVAPYIKERHVEIEVDKPLPNVCGDPGVLDQVLENLILNAIKFVPSERRPHIQLFAERNQGKVRLSIEDNGIGVPLEHRERIFKPFERLHTTGYAGTGIGLAIVQRGVEKMGGQVGVEPAPVEGSRFWIELPEECVRHS